MVGRERSPVRRHPAPGRRPGRGARGQRGGVPGEDAGLHAASTEGAHSMGQRGAGPQGGVRGEGAEGGVQPVCDRSGRPEDTTPRPCVKIHHFSGKIGKQLCHKYVKHSRQIQTRIECST